MGTLNRVTNEWWQQTKLPGIVVSVLAWQSLGRGIESCLGIRVVLSTKHAMKWLLSLFAGSDGGMGEPG